MNDTKWKHKWACPSSSTDGYYTVAQDGEGNFACSCIGWTRHTPRTDCKHIKQVRFLEKGESSTAMTMETAIINRMLGRAIGLLK
jgi:hypothetical protein